MPSLELSSISSALGSPHTSSLNSELKPGYCIPHRTKLNVARMEQVRIRLGFAHGVFVLAAGLVGGVCLIWRLKVDIVVSNSNHNLIDAVIRENNDQWRLLCCYGPLYGNRRKQFWENLAKCVETGEPNWLVLGDLNCVVVQEEDKDGARLVRGHVGQEIRAFIDEAGAVDLGCFGVWHSWCNKRSFGDRIYEQLDRALAFLDWCVAFPSVGVQSFARVSSNHSPILLDTMMERGRLPTPFRFLDVWTKDQRSKEVVNKAWAIQVGGFESFKLAVWLGNTRKALSVWNKAVFGLCQFKLSFL